MSKRREPGAMFKGPAKLALFLLLLVAAPGRAEEETFACDTTEGFVLTPPPPAAGLAVEGGRLAMKYERAAPPMLVHAAVLTDLAELRITVTSQADLPLACVLPDRDGARWVHLFQVPAGKAVELAAAPSDFTLTDDSPVKKAKLEPERLGMGYVLLDVGARMGAKGANTLVLQRVVVRHADPAVQRGELDVEGGVEVSKSTLQEGDLHVRKGARLRITAPRFVVKGDLFLEGGTLEVDGGGLVVPQRFNHERRLDLRPGSRLSFRGAFVCTRVPMSLDLADDAEYESVGTQVAGFFTVSTSPRSAVTVTGQRGGSEFNIAPGARCAFRDDETLALWFQLGSNLKGKVSFPPGGRVDVWTAGAGYSVSVTSCSDVQFCLLSTPGSDGEVAGSEVRAAGVFVGGAGAVTLAGLTNGEKTKDLRLPLGDRSLRFTDSTVRAWTVYPVQQAKVTLERCVIGETLAMMDAHEELSDSTCDGSGGYFGTSQRSSIHAVRCKLACLVVARDESTIVLEDCDVTGDIHVAGKATVKLVRCRVSGRVEKDPGATLVQE